MKIYDLVIIGSGPAGLEVNYMLQDPEKKVCFIEKVENSFGGTCVNRGCMPTKMMVKSADILKNIQKAEQFGIKAGTSSADLGEIFKLKTKLTGRLSAMHNEMTRADKIFGHARFLNNEVIEITRADGRSQQIQGKHVVIATGARPKIIPGIETDGNVVCTSDDLLENSSLPEQMLVVGGGAIGLEFASMYHHFGTQVTLIEAQPFLVPDEDSDTGMVIRQCLENRHIQVFTNTSLQSIEIQDGKARCSFEGDLAEPRVFDKVLIGAGRQPNIDDLGLENTDIEVEKGFIKVNERLQTKVAHIFAAGDVIPTPMLAHAAVLEARVIVSNLKEPGSMTYDSPAIPKVIYSDPEIASTGLTEKQAGHQYDNIKVLHFPMAMSPKGIVDGTTDGRLKLIYSAGNGRLLGASIIGSAATEIIHELNLAVNCKLTIKQLDNTVHAHPTMAETIWFAILKGKPFDSTKDFMAAMAEAAK